MLFDQAVILNSTRCTIDSMSTNLYASSFLCKLMTNRITTCGHYRMCKLRCRMSSADGDFPLWLCFALLCFAFFSFFILTKFLSLDLLKVFILLLHLQCFKQRLFRIVVALYLSLAVITVHISPYRDGKPAAREASSQIYIYIYIYIYFTRRYIRETFQEDYQLGDIAVSP